MMELGNDVVNNIYEAGYRANSNDSDASASSQVQRADSDSDNSVREAWIKAKYVEKSFVLPLDCLKSNVAVDSNSKSNQLLDIRLSGSGWSVRRARRRKLLTKTSENKISAAEKTSVEDSTSGSSEVSIESTRDENDDFNLGSDQDSTDGEDNDSFVNEEDLTTLNAEYLLYKASAAHNLPVMCYALALSASKNWANDNDAKRTALHQAVLSVRTI